MRRQGKGEVVAPAPAPATTATATTSTSGNTQQQQQQQGSSAKVAVDYEKSIKEIGSFKTVEGFWELYNHLIRPKDVPKTTDYHMFRTGVKPIWEDPGNRHGGKWIIRLRKGLTSKYWESTLLAIIGERLMEEGAVSSNSVSARWNNSNNNSRLDDEICGAVVSIRQHEDILAVWNRNADNQEANARIKEGLRRVLELPSFVSMEYKRHDSSMQDNSSFRNTIHDREAQAAAAASVAAGSGVNNLNSNTGYSQQQLQSSASNNLVGGGGGNRSGPLASSSSSSSSSSGAWRSRGGGYEPSSYSQQPPASSSRPIPIAGNNNSISNNRPGVNQYDNSRNSRW